MRRGASNDSVRDPRRSGTRLGRFDCSQPRSAPLSVLVEASAAALKGGIEQEEEEEDQDEGGDPDDF